MSDYISNDQNYAKFFNMAYGKMSCPSYEIYSGQHKERRRLFDKDVEFNVQENLVGGSGRCYQQGTIVGSDSVQSDGNNLSEIIDFSYVRELQRLSSSLIRLLSESKQRGLKVGKTSDWVSQRPQPEQRSKHRGDWGHSRCRLSERQFATQLGSSLDTNTPGQANNLVKHFEEVPVGGTSTGNTMSFTKKDVSPIFMFPQTDTTTSFTNGLSGQVFSPQYSDRPKTDTHKEKERRKKDTHNTIEKRRRSIISDRITELRNLLPEHIDRASCKKKGSILKESVDYIKKLKKDNYRLYRLEDQMSEISFEVQKLTLRLEKLETRLTTTVTNSDNNGHLQDKTSADSNINSSLTEILYTANEHSTPALTEHSCDELGFGDV